MEKEKKTGDKVNKATYEMVEAVKGYRRGKTQGKYHIRKPRDFQWPVL